MIEKISSGTPETSPQKNEKYISFFLRIGNYILKYYNVKLFFERLLKKFTFQSKKQPVTIFWFLL
jgi:hypothetical protein